MSATESANEADRSTRYLVARRRAASIALGATGAVLAVLLFGRVQGPVGPFDASVALQLRWSGGTVVRIAPLGTLELDTHKGPFGIDARVEELRVEEARAIVDQPSLLAGVEDDIAADAKSMLVRLLVKSMAAGVAGGLLVSLLRARSRASLVTGGGAALAIATACLALASATWRPQALSEPRYTGLLRIAPSAVGSARSINERFSEYRAQLARLVGNLATLYQTAEGLPVFEPDESVLRVLHVSDVHLNPQAFDVMQQLVKQFKVDAVVDAGDTTDFGTAVESDIAGRIGKLGIPYAWVRGNHDSEETTAAVAAQPNAIVLDGQAADVAGLKVWGIGDPRFTPDKSDAVDIQQERAQADLYAPTVARKLRADSPVDVDVLLVHDPRIAADSGDLVPLVLAGHMHKPRRARIGKAVLLVQGSTGGAGLRGLEADRAVPLTCSVLYFDRDSGRIRAYDQISIAGLGETEVRIERHVFPPPPSDASTTTTTTAR